MYGRTELIYSATKNNFLAIDNKISVKNEKKNVFLVFEPAI